jgi:hypothetical protein
MFISLVIWEFGRKKTLHPVREQRCGKMENCDAVKSHAGCEKMGTADTSSERVPNYKIETNKKSPSVGIPTGFRVGIGECRLGGQTRLGRGSFSSRTYPDQIR